MAWAAAPVDGFVVEVDVLPGVVDGLLAGDPEPHAGSASAVAHSTRTAIRLDGPNVRLHAVRGLSRSLGNMAHICNCELSRATCLRLPSDQNRTLVTSGVTASFPLARYPVGGPIR